MDEAKKYLEQELAVVEQRIAEAQALVADLGDEAEQEVKKLTDQRDALMKAMEPGESEEDMASSESFKVAILEVRPGVGGDEAKIWADDLMRMYTRYANLVGWKVSDLDDGVMRISGKGAFDALHYETGVHRVQRVPETEAQGRIHTSTASVVVLPEVPESVVEVREDDLTWEFTRGGGHGGQNVNKVATAVRLIHNPSGVVVQARQERSQEQNRKIALALLRSELWEIEEEKKLSAISSQRLAIGKSLRSEKIRTYNYPQNRVTDHRIGKSWHKLDKIVEGDLGDVLTALCKEYTPGNNQSADSEGASD